MKAHRTDSLSLFFGVVFLVVASGYLAGSYLEIGLPDMGWIIAAALIFFGLVGVIGALIPWREPITPQSPPAQDTETPTDVHPAQP